MVSNSDLQCFGLNVLGLSDALVREYERRGWALTIREDEVRRADILQTDGGEPASQAVGEPERQQETTHKHTQAGRSGQRRDTI